MSGRRPRKPPRPHRVNPTDPRYTSQVRAMGYPRGSGHPKNLIKPQMSFADELTYYDYAFDNMRIALIDYYKNDPKQLTQKINLLDEAKKARIWYSGLGEHNRGTPLSFSTETDFIESAYTTTISGARDAKRLGWIREHQYEEFASNLYKAKEKRIRDQGLS